MRSAGRINAVSRMHCEVTREMWAPLWDDSPANAPIRALTNGIHLPTWISAEMSKLFEQHLRGDWRDRCDEPAFWQPLLDVPDEDLWVVRRMLRSFLFTFIRERARRRWTDEQASAARVVAGGTLLDPEALTIGFARRFTGYKRPELIFHDTERLARILTAFRRPVQIVFAGKAHPADDVGKLHLQHVFKRAVDPTFAGRIAFLDDYDLHVAHFLVQGCDVWLNTPRKPLEASGTSGMKASVNGVPHLSIGDGWWAEGYNGQNGWMFDGGAAATASLEEVDAADAAALYTLLETEVVPTFYDRDAHDVPRRWLRIVKQAICSVAPRFCSRRMMKQYAEEMYALAGGDTAVERGREIGGFGG